MDLFILAFVTVDQSCGSRLGAFGVQSALALLTFAHAQGVPAARLAGKLRRPGLPGWRKAVFVSVTAYFVDAELGLFIFDSRLVQDVNFFWRSGRVDLELSGGDGL